MNDKTKNDNTTIAKTDKIRINLNIAERVYPLKIKREEEENIRKAAKLINEKIEYYKTKYEKRDIQDALSMVTLQFVLKLFVVTEDIDTVQNELSDLNVNIDNYLQIREKK
jgi:cell division protein ZapA